MKVRRFFMRSFLALYLSLFACSGSVTSKEPFQPKLGQRGKDVIWVPTAQALVDKILDMAKVTPEDYLIDLGSGDGRTVIAAAKRGARAVGIEYNADLVELSKRKAAEEGVGHKTQFLKADLFESDLSGATVITMFLLPQLNLKLRPKLLELEPGTRIVSNTFHMGHWKSDAIEQVTDGCASYCTAHLWIVPAKAAGTWRFPGGVLRLQQKFQVLSGTLETGRQIEFIQDGRLYGDRINFRAGGVQYVGKVKGDAIDGTIIADGKPHLRWSAKRIR